MARGDDILTIVQAGDVEFVTSVDYEGPLRPGDFVFLTDEIAFAYTFDLALNDLVVMDDLATAAFVWNRDLADAVAMSDALALQTISYRDFADAVLVTDTASASKGGDLDTADAVTLADALANSTTKALADAVAMSDAVQTGLVVTANFADAVALTDAVANAPTIVPADAVAVTDVGTVVPAGDPLWANVILLSHFDGANMGKNVTFLDSSPFAATITPNGVGQGGVSPYVGAGGSGLMGGGSTQGLTVAAGAQHDLGSGDFTVECWVRPTAAISTTKGLVAVWDQNTRVVGEYALGVNIAATGKVSFMVGNGGATSILVSAAAVLPLNVWTHLAAVRSGGVVTLYTNGVSEGSIAHASGIGVSTKALTVGRLPNVGTSEFAGYISDARTSNVARYTANFTPPTAPFVSDVAARFLASFTNASVTDSAQKSMFSIGTKAMTSTAQKKFGPAALSVAGESGDGELAVYTPNIGNLFAFGTGDFTVEMWVYRNAGSNAYVFDLRTDVYTSAQWPYMSIGSNLQWGSYAGGMPINVAFTQVSNTWQHFAISRTAGQIRAFIDGVLLQTAADPNNYTCGTNIYLGAGVEGRIPLVGYMDEMRVTKGVGRYTASFTPPTGPFLDTGPFPDPATTALITRMTVYPTPARITLIDNLIKALKSAGVWTKLDALYVMAAADAQAARLNWKGPVYDMTLSGAPTFVADRGYNSTNSTGANYLLTGFNPATAGGLFARNSASLHVWSRTAAASGNRGPGNWDTGTSYGTTMVPRFTGDTFVWYVNGPTEVQPASTDGSGFFSINRSGAAATQAYRNGALIQAGTTASAAMASLPFFFNAYNEGGFANTTARQEAAGAYGASLTGPETLAFYTALQAYMTGVGA